MKPFDPLNPEIPSIQAVEEETLRRIQNLPFWLNPTNLSPGLGVQEESEEPQEEEEEEEEEEGEE